jgi:hypothetical protein
VNFTFHGATLREATLSQREEEKTARQIFARAGRDRLPATPLFLHPVSDEQGGEQNADEQTRVFMP